MNCFGNTIARALALVTIGTTVAFVHWAIKPLRLTLDQPGSKPPPAQLEPDGAAPSQADAGQPDGTRTEPVTPPQAGDGGGQATPPDPGQNQQPALDPDSLGSEIGTTEAHQLWLTGAVAFIDARPQKDYLAGHIPYAYLVPAESLADGRLGDMMEFGGVTPGTRVVVYCEGGSCDASHLVALNLQDMGFDKIHIDTDGFPGWQAAGHEVETGPDQVLGDVP